jgi:hypothetical protein
MTRSKQPDRTKGDRALLRMILSRTPSRAQTVLPTKPSGRFLSATFTSVCPALRDGEPQSLQVTCRERLIHSLQPTLVPNPWLARHSSGSCACQRGNCTRNPDSTRLCPECRADLQSRGRPERGRDDEARCALVAKWHMLNSEFIERITGQLRSHPSIGALS